MPEQPRQVVEPGTLPSWLLDQSEFWIDPQGYQHHIATLDRAMVEFVIVYLFSYASRVRMAWSMEEKQSFDTDQKPRMWLLTKPAVRALIERLAIINRMEMMDDENH